MADSTSVDFKALIEKYATQHGIDPNLIEQIILTVIFLNIIIITIMQLQVMVLSFKKQIKYYLLLHQEDK